MLWLAMPVLLTVLYGFTECRVLAACGGSRLNSAKNWAWTFLPTAVPALAWIAVGFPLPLCYLLLYLLWRMRFVHIESDGNKRRFFFNLNYSNTLTLHMIFIGITSLLLKTPMHVLLTSPAWRAVGTSLVLAVSVVEDLLFLHKRGFAAEFSAAAVSPEGKPFISFLGFCNAYLLVDSLLCAADQEIFYTPLFLVGSSAFLIFFEIRFLLHIRSLLHSNHLKEEHDALEAQLQSQNRSVGTLRQMADRDTLTGVASRRSVMEQLSEMLAENKAFSVIFLDLDHLKQINDSEGHDAGDQYLVGFTSALAARLRAGDVLARVGGDEFVVLMPDCDAQTAGLRMSAIRADILQSAGRFGFSYGVTEVFHNCKNGAEAILAEADRAMYEDKAQRR